MLAQLQALEQTIIAMKKQYAVTATELANLKQRLANDDSPQRIVTLQNELQKANQEIDAYCEQVDSLEHSRNTLQQQIEDLYQANQALVKQNQDLKDKNALAISRAEVIRDWLAKIDNSNQ